MDERVKELDRLLWRLEWLPDSRGNLRCPECFGHALHEPECALDAALSGAPLRLSDAELLGDPARTVGWPTDQGAAQQGRAPEAPLTPEESAAAFEFMKFTRESLPQEEVVPTEPDQRASEAPEQCRGAATLGAVAESGCGPRASPAAAAPEAAAYEERIDMRGLTPAEMDRALRAAQERRAKAAAPSPRPPEPEGRISKGLAFRAVLVVLEELLADSRFAAFWNGQLVEEEASMWMDRLTEAVRLALPAQPPDPAPAAASAGLREALNECCNVIETIMEAGILKFNTSTEARHDFRATAARGRAALRAAPLPEQPSDARAASAGEGALREALDGFLESHTLPLNLSPTITYRPCGAVVHCNYCRDARAAIAQKEK